MTSTDSQTAAKLQGRMFLFENPELLNQQSHAALGLAKIDRPFDFAAHAATMPLTVSEFSTAQKYYPIVFATLDNPIPLASMSAIEPFNLFVDEAGQWDSTQYIPAYVRCYPFALAAGADKQTAVVIDRAAPMISENPLQPFFDGGQLSVATQALIDFCISYEQDRKRTEDFSRKLKELNILTSQQATQKLPGQEERTVAEYFAVDTDRFQALEDGVVKDLFDSGIMALIHAHLFSLENWTRLIARFGERQRADGSVS